MSHRFYLRAEDIQIDTDDGRFCLIITDADEGRESQIDIHDCVLELFGQMLRDVGPYAHEAGFSRTMPQPVTTPVDDVYAAIDAGYALDDPKSPGYHDRMVD